MRSKAQVKSIVESAFADQPVDALRSGPGLETVIVAIRTGLERKGFKLFPWSAG